MAKKPKKPDTDTPVESVLDTPPPPPPLELMLMRFSSQVHDTLGVLHVWAQSKGWQFLCFTLEDEYRQVKVPGDTRISAGLFEVRYRTVGTMHKTYGDKYGPLHKGMLEVVGVPNFDAVLIHAGNSEKDTRGCILVGNNVRQNLTALGFIEESFKAYERVYPLISGALDAGRKVTLRVTDFDRLPLLEPPPVV